MAEEGGDSPWTSGKMLALQFFILSGLLVFFIWLGIRPKPPSYTITDFSVENRTISFSLEVANSNKESDVYYGNTNFTCYNNQQFLGNWLFNPFNQDKEDKTPLSGTIHMEDKVGKALQLDIAGNRAGVRVTLVTKFGYKTWGIKSPRKKLHQSAKLPIGPNGKIAGKTKLD